jgi:hypothetical protein
MIDFTIHVRTVNPTNNRQHWRPVWRRSKDQRLAASTGAWAGKVSYHIELPVVATMTRISPGTLDDDNLRPALKSIRDGIADAFGVADNDPRIEWRYDQQKGKRGDPAVRITITAKGEA